MYTEMASRHRVRSHQLHIIKTIVVKSVDCKRGNIVQFLDPKLKFPVTRKCVPLSCMPASFRPNTQKHASWSLFVVWAYIDIFQSTVFAQLLECMYPNQTIQAMHDC